MMPVIFISFFFRDLYIYFLSLDISSRVRFLLRCGCVFLCVYTDILYFIYFAPVSEYIIVVFVQVRKKHCLVSSLFFLSYYDLSNWTDVTRCVRKSGVWVTNFLWVQVENYDSVTFLVLLVLRFFLTFFFFSETHILKKKERKKCVSSRSSSVSLPLIINS